MKVAIYSRVLESTQQKDVQLFFDELYKEQIIPVVFEPYLKEANRYLTLPSSTETFSGYDDLTEEIDFLISLGGDGTLLDTVTLIRNKRIPVAGINFGRLGFLAGIDREKGSFIVPNPLRLKKYLLLSGHDCEAFAVSSQRFTGL